MHLRSSALAIGVAVGAMALSATPASATDGTSSSGLDSWNGGQACVAASTVAKPGCETVVSKRLRVTNSWTRYTLTCPIDKPYVTATRSSSEGDGWDWQYTDNVDKPDIDVVGAQSNSLTVSIDSSVSDFVYGVLAGPQYFKFAVGCSAGAPAR